MSSLKKWSKIAGSIYLLTIVAAILNMIFIESNLQYTSASNLVDTLFNNQSSLRYSIAFELVMFSSVVVLSIALYNLLVPVDKTLSLLAMAFRLGEAVIGGVAVLLGFGLLLLVNGSYDVLLADNFQGLVLFIYELRTISYLVLYGFMSIGSIIIFYVTIKHKMLPKFLSIYGFVTYSLMLSWTFTNIFIKDIPEIVEWISIGPGAIFEMVIGIWLILKGFRYHKLNA